MDIQEIEDLRAMLHTGRTLFPCANEERGIAGIWMHTPCSSVVLKQIYGAPPVSLYGDLPKRFCFRETESLPGFLAREKKTVRQLRGLPDARLQKFML
jgi:hypothetical protein